MKPETHYFTFGVEHPLSGCFVKATILGYDKRGFSSADEVARGFMMRTFGAKWAFQYNEEEFKGQRDKYGLMQIFEVTIDHPTFEKVQLGEGV